MWFSHVTRLFRFVLPPTDDVDLHKFEYLCVFLMIPFMFHRIIYK